MALDHSKLREKASQEQFTKEEVQYLRDTVGDSWALELLKENEDGFGAAPSVDLNDAAEVDRRVQELRRVIDEANSELTQLGERQAQPADAVAGSGEQVAQAAQGAPYEGWTVPRLKDELHARNEQREADGVDPLSTTGTKVELIARLVQDDNEQEDDEPTV